jgi:hypothetical protein
MENPSPSCMRAIETDAGGFDIQPSASLLLQPRSLLIFCNDAYHKFSHGIDTVRITLTLTVTLSPIHRFWLSKCWLGYLVRAEFRSPILPLSTALLRNTQAEEDFMGESIVNLGATGLQLGDLVERKGERVSLTVRRVLKTRKNLVRL